MKKRVLGSILAFAGILALASCGDDAGKTSAPTSAPTSTPTSTPGSTPVETSGKVLNVYAWNEEFKGFFEKYVSDEKIASTETGAPEKYHIDGVEVKWTIKPSDNGQYQDALDLALEAQSKASADNKVDMFLAEADYILKYADDECTQDITKIGVTD